MIFCILPSLLFYMLDYLGAIRLVWLSRDLLGPWLFIGLLYDSTWLEVVGASRFLVA